MFIVTLPLVVLGMFFFWWGLQHWQRARKIEDTPTTPIGRLPREGAVEVKGRIRAVQTTCVAGTELRCAWYHLVIAVLEGLGRSAHLAPRTESRSHTLMEIYDGTGSIRVNPEGAEIVGEDAMVGEDSERRRALKNLHGTDGDMGRVHLSWIPEGAKVYALGTLRKTAGGGSILAATAEAPLILRMGSEAAQLADEKRRGMGLFALGTVPLLLVVFLWLV